MDDKLQFLRKEIAYLVELRDLNANLFRHVMGLVFELVKLLKRVK